MSRINSVIDGVILQGVCRSRRLSSITILRSCLSSIMARKQELREKVISDRTWGRRSFNLTRLISPRVEDSSLNVRTSYHHRCISFCFLFLFFILSSFLSLISLLLRPGAVFQKHGSIHILLQRPCLFSFVFIPLFLPV